MAPFHSTLSIWIGGIVLVAMLKVTVSKKCLDGMRRVKTHQIYLGRYIISLDHRSHAKHIDCRRRPVVFGHSMRASVSVPVGVLVLQHRLYQYHLHADRLFRRHRRRQSVSFCWLFRLPAPAVRFRLKSHRNFSKRFIRCCRLCTAWQPCARLSAACTARRIG